MCQLLGICANRQVDINLSFREWRHPTTRCTSSSGSRPTVANWSDSSMTGTSWASGRSRRPDERAVLVATQPLANETAWQRLVIGELLLVREGIVQARIGR
jgi:predicted glutamine amidotransferase